MKRSIKSNIDQRITANQQRAAAVLQQGERERELLRELNRKASEQTTK